MENALTDSLPDKYYKLALSFDVCDDLKFELEEHHDWQHTTYI